MQRHVTRSKSLLSLDANHWSTSCRDSELDLYSPGWVAVHRTSRPGERAVTASLSRVERPRLAGCGITCWLGWRDSNPILPRTSGATLGNHLTSVGLSELNSTHLPPRVAVIN